MFAVVNLLKGRVPGEQISLIIRILMNAGPIRSSIGMGGVGECRRHGVVLAARTA